MSKIVAIVLCAALLGCRREDVRVFEERCDGLTDAKMSEVRRALGKYEGVRIETVKLASGSVLRLEYDSMKIAKENIRREVEACLK